MPHDSSQNYPCSMYQEIYSYGDANDISYGGTKELRPCYIHEEGEKYSVHMYLSLLNLYVFVSSLQLFPASSLGSHCSH